MTSVNVLAMVLSSQGKYGQAEEILQQTLSVTELVLGKGHPDILVSMSYLVIVLRR
jgi:Tetratricopeptide repeat